MKKLRYLLLCLLVVGLLAGCGTVERNEEPVIQVVEPEPILATPEPADKTPEATAVPDVEATEAPEESGEVEKADTPTIEDREVVDGMKQSYLTGEWKAEEVVDRRPMAVMLGNNKKLLPQWGISQASIIYEAPVEGRITRLMAIIEDYDDLDMVGPVRSSRDYYIYEAMAYDAIYCNWGLAVPYVEDLLKSDRIDNISQAVLGVHNPYSAAFFRRERPGYATEYTGYMSIDGYTKGVKKFGYETDYRSSFEQAFTFANDGWVADYEGYKDATVIYPGGTDTNRSGYASNEGNNPYFEYNDEDGLYYRYQFGAAHIDEMNGEQLTVSNVILKVCNGEVRDANDYLAFGVHGTGDAYIFTNGKVIKGTWSRESDSGANMFYDEDGKEVVFSQGKTWICCIWKDYEDCISWN